MSADRMPTLAEMKAFDRGVTAYERESPLDANPYRLSDSRADFWSFGWTHAKMKTRTTKREREWQEYLDELDSVE